MTKPCDPDCGGYADYAAVPCPNPACADRVKQMQAKAASRYGDFTCALCGITAPRGQSLEAAAAEHLERFGIPQGEGAEEGCDPCDKLVMDWFNALPEAEQVEYLRRVANGE